MIKPSRCLDTRGLANDQPDRHRNIDGRVAAGTAVLRHAPAHGVAAVQSCRCGSNRAACPPYCRRIFLNDRDITSLRDRFVTEIRRSTFGFVFHRLYLINGISALENIVAPAYPNGEKSCLLRQRALDLLAKIRIS
jgi:hypothetical protein